MSDLIFITGKQGSGKSHIARTWATTNQARHIDVDRILVAGGKGIPDWVGRDHTNWELWRGITPQQRDSYIRKGLTTAFPALEFTEDFVVEGAILCNGWFFDPLLQVLKELKSMNVNVHSFYLNASNEVILRNVHERAAADPTRRGHEKDQFRTVGDIATAHEGFDQAVKLVRDRWSELSSSEELTRVLRKLSEDKNI